MILAISAAAKELGITAGTLRTYERIGVYKAQRNSNGGRIYFVDDLEALRRLIAERKGRIGMGRGNKWP